MPELEELMDSFAMSGGDKVILADEETAHLVVSGNAILSSRTVYGLEVEAIETETGISAKVIVLEGVRLKKPVHMCFGILHKRGSQEIKMDVELRRGSSAHFIAHCIFPGAEQVRHVMDAVIHVAEGAEMRYSETHFHGMHGGVEVVPRASVTIGKNGRYFSEFMLTTGMVGVLDIDYSVEAGEDAVAELTARVFGHAKDDIKIKERVVLAGKGSRSLIKTRVALEGEASAEVTGITEGNAEGARGHVDCMEIITGNAVAKAVPIVTVSSPLAKVTHEAAIGSVDKRQMETLMAHGLTPEEAVDIIVTGILA